MHVLTAEPQAAAVLLSYLSLFWCYSFIKDCALMVYFMKWCTGVLDEMDIISIKSSRQNGCNDAVVL